MGKIYGAAYKDMELNENAYEILVRLIMEKTTAVRLLLAQHIKENGAEPSSIREFMDEYTGVCGWSVDGVFGVVRDIINEAEFGGNPIFTIETGLGVHEFIPETDEDMAMYPSQEKVRKILGEYLNPILKHPAEVDWNYAVEWVDVFNAEEMPVVKGIDEQAPFNT